jgi:hypothetical protein
MKMATEEVKNVEMFDLADTLRELQEKKALLQEELKDVNGQIKDTTGLLSEQMINHEIQNFNRNGRLFYLATQRYISAVASMREQLHETLRERGFGDLIKETVHPQTLRAFVREQIEENDDEVPEWLDDLVTVYEEDQVRIRKA